MKLLAICDSPTRETGFARLAKNLLIRWVNDFERIDVWAIGYSGYRGAPGTVGKSRFQQPPFVLYSASPEAKVPWYDAHRLQELLNHIMAGDYTHIWIVQDHFCLVMHNFPEMLREACLRKGIRSFYYCPVDGVMESKWAEIVEQVDVPVAYTRFGHDELRRHTGTLLKPGGGVFPDIRVLPHGVDTGVYKPLPLDERLRLREEKSKGWLRPEDVVLLNVNANQRRKDIPRSLEILACLKRQHPDRTYRLIMHMARESVDGVDMEMAGRQFGLVLGEDYEHMDNHFRGVHAMLPEKELNEIYNIADLLISTTLGEGWGFSITEALAAGLPVAVPDHTACREIMQFAAAHGMGGRCIPLRRGGHTITAYDNSRVRPVVDVVDAAERIHAHAFQWGERTGLPREVALEWSWARIAEEWLKLFRSIPRVEVMGIDRSLAAASMSGDASDGLPLPAKSRLTGRLSAPRSPSPVRSAPVHRRHHYYMEIYGGLGDAFSTLMHRGSGKALENLGPHETATVALYVTNPYVSELFTHHPKRSQIQVVDTELWRPEHQGPWPKLVQEARGRCHLPRRSGVYRMPNVEVKDKRDIRFFPGPETAARIIEWTARRPIILLAASAGLPDRSFSAEQVERIVTGLQERLPRHEIVAVGRTYERHGRAEIAIPERPGVRNVIDQLTAPGVAELLRRAVGLVTCHSALNLLAWHWEIPQLLLYPQGVVDAHLREKDEWGFGIDNGRTIHGLFDALDESMIGKFAGLIHS